MQERASDEASGKIAAIRPQMDPGDRDLFVAGLRTTIALNRSRHRP